MEQRTKTLSDDPDSRNVRENGGRVIDGSESGTEHGHDHHAAQLGRLFWVMTVIAIPVVTFSPMFASLLGYGVPEHGWTTWISPVLGTAMYAWGGQRFLSGGLSEVKSRRPGMMLLIGLAITVAFISSSWGSTLGLLANDLDFWWELALLVVIMLVLRDRDKPVVDDRYQPPGRATLRP